MQNFLDNDLRELNAAEELRRCNIVSVTLDSTLQQVQSLKEVLEGIIENVNNTKARYKALCDAVSEELERACDGNVTVTSYVQKQMAKQQVSIYVGTHWLTMPMQLFFDWVKDAAYKTGLTGTYCEDPRFMNQLYEQMAFRVARYREQVIPTGEVWINLQNGTLELDSRGKMRFRKHHRGDFFTYVLPYEYDPEARCPLWFKTLDRILPDLCQQQILGEYIGYCFTKDLRLEKCLILEGPGGNGKSVVSEVMISVLGDVNVSRVDWELLTTDENYRATCVGKLANISQENGQNIKHSILKNMVSGEAVMVKQLYKDPLPTTDYGKLVALFNQLPKTESTNAYVRRLLILGFHTIITDEERDIDLINKLKDELPGILNWVLDHLQGLVARKAFVRSEACEEAVRSYLRDQNSALRFFEEGGYTLNDDGRYTLKDLFSEYQTFCREESIKNTFGKKNFSKQLQTIGVQSRTINGSHYLNVKKAE